jgi:MYXO-CTERM domain-containing protein
MSIARNLFACVLALALCAACGGGEPGAVQSSALARGSSPINTVFLIMMENHNWKDIKGSSSAPYINNTLLPIASHSENHRNPGYLHPSEPNYLWLEAGTNFGVTNDNDPSSNHQSTTQHLTTLLQNAGLTWKSYQEDIDGLSCPLGSTGKYAPKHNGPVFFDDVTGGNNPKSANCIAHVRPYAELAGDLANGFVPNFVYITPNLCNDMHDTIGCSSLDAVKNGDDWLSREVPKILASAAYRSGGALFITWDESEGGEFPVGMIVLSPSAKGGGYAGNVATTHSSTLRTFQEIFDVSPFLGDAANASDLSDLFQHSLAKSCSADGQCGSGQVCRNGECQANPPAGSCQSDADCSGSLACVSGTCQTRPSSSCPPGTTNIGGVCVPSGCASNSGSGSGWLAALLVAGAALLLRRRRSESDLS